MTGIKFPSIFNILYQPLLAIESWSITVLLYGKSEREKFIHQKIAKKESNGTSCYGGGRRYAIGWKYHNSIENIARSSYMKYMWSDTHFNPRVLFISRIIFDRIHWTDDILPTISSILKREWEFLHEKWEIPSDRAYQTIPVRMSFCLMPRSHHDSPYSWLVHREARLMNSWECRVLITGTRRCAWKARPAEEEWSSFAQRSCELPHYITRGVSSSSAFLHISFFLAMRHP